MVQLYLILSGSDTFLIWKFPQVGNLRFWSLRIRVKQAQRTACPCAPKHVLLFRTCDANSRMRIVNITRGPRIQDGARARRQQERKAQKAEAVTPHRPAKWPRLFQADQQETELRQRRTFRKWWHNLAVYYASNLNGSCVNSLLRR